MCDDFYELEYQIMILNNVKLHEIMGDDFLTFIGRVTVMVSMVVDMILPLVAFA